jgi:glycosyltransferase involved in cell wall biosynthesis
MKQRVLHVLPNLRHSSAARQLGLLAAGLSRQDFDCRVIALGNDGPAAAGLAATGVEIEALGWSHIFDPRPLWKLRRWIQMFQPNIIHAWQRPALRALCLMGHRTRVVVSQAVPRQSLGPATPLARWLLRAADRVVVAGPADAERSRRLGLPDAALRPARLAVPTPPPRSHAEIRARLLERFPAIPPRARFVACIGPLDPHKGLREAVWAFAILHYLYNDLHLLMIGSGPEAARLRQDARQQGVPDRVHLLGDRSDVPDLLGVCEVAWVLGRHGGDGAVLEAMAAGRPILAARRPDLAELLGADEAGVLVSARDTGALARQTRHLLEDSTLRARFGEAGRRRAARHFAVADMIRDYEGIYKELAG